MKTPVQFDSLLGRLEADVEARIRSLFVRCPSLHGFATRCRSGKRRVTVAATTDSPLASLVLRMGGKTFRSTTAAVSGAIRTRHRTKARVTATDKAGLSAALSRTVKPCR